MREGKFTLPAIYAYLTSAKVIPAIEALVKQIKSGEATNDQINEMIQFVKNNGGMDMRLKVMETIVTRQNIFWIVSRIISIRNRYYDMLIM